MNINASKNVQSVCEAELGTHYCLFYKSEEDLIKIMAQYFMHGLENNDFCIWVAGDTDIERKAREMLFESITDRKKSEIEKQIEFQNSREWYLRGGSFQPDIILQSWQSLIDYEMHLNDVIPNDRIAAVCSYPLDRMSASEMIEVTQHHQLAIAKNNGEWHIFETHKPLNFRADDISIDVELWQEDIFNLPTLKVDECDGCGLCISVCHNDALYLINNRVKFKENAACDWCTDCETVCPTNAITCPFQIV
ncbi:MEDS domain-containing protein [Chloroflexota bacterium]